MPQVPLLMEPDDLTTTERVALAALQQQPGYPVLEKLFAAACNRAIEEVIKLDPVDEGYELKLKALQSRARERNQFSSLIINSIAWQAKVVSSQSEEIKEEPQVNRIVKGLK
jgi:hypothetical protein